jgi:hypothetical protein
MKSLTALLAGLGLVACTSTPLQEGFEGSPAPLHADTLYTSLVFERLSAEEFTRTMLPEKQIKKIRLYMQDDVASYNYFYSDSLQRWTFQAQEYSKVDAVAELFQLIGYPETKGLAEKASLGIAIYWHDTTDMALQSYTSDLAYKLEDKLERTFVDVMYDSIPGVLLSPYRAPVHKLKK